jgi:hypothetical protein
VFDSGGGGISNSGVGSGPSRGYGCTTAAIRAAQQSTSSVGCRCVVLSCSHPYIGKCSVVYL